MAKFTGYFDAQIVRLKGSTSGLESRFSAAERSLADLASSVAAGEARAQVTRDDASFTLLPTAADSLKASAQAGTVKSWKWFGSLELRRSEQARCRCQGARRDTCMNTQTCT